MRLCSLLQLGLQVGERCGSLGILFGAGRRDSLPPRRIVPADWRRSWRRRRSAVPDRLAGFWRLRRPRASCRARLSRLPIGFARSVSWLAGRRALRKPRCLVVAGRRDSLPPRRIVPADWRGSWRRRRPAVPDRLAGFWRWRRPRASCRARLSRRPIDFARSVSWLAGRRALRKPRRLVVAGRQDSLPPRRIVPADWRGSWRRRRSAVPDRLAGFWRLRRPRASCRARLSRRPIDFARSLSWLAGRQALRKPRRLVVSGRQHSLPPRRIVPADWRGSWRQRRSAVPDRLAGFWRLRRPRESCRARLSRRPIDFARSLSWLAGRRALWKPRRLAVSGRRDSLPPRRIVPADWRGSWRRRRSAVPDRLGWLLVFATAASVLSRSLVAASIDFARSLSWLAGRQALWKPRRLAVAGRQGSLPPRRIVPADWRGSWRQRRPAVPDRLAGFWCLRRPRQSCRARSSRRPVDFARSLSWLAGRQVGLVSRHSFDLVSMA